MGPMPEDSTGMLPASGRREARTASVPDEILVVSERGMDLLAIETAVRQRLRGLRMRTARDMNAAREIARAAPAVRFVLIADHLLRRIAPVLGLRPLKDEDDARKALSVKIIETSGRGRRVAAH